MAVARKYAARGLRVAPEIVLRSFATAMALFALFGFNPQALAATDTWTGASGTDWVTTANWSDSSGTGLNSGDSIVFTSTDPSGAILGDTLTSSSFNIAGITFNAGSPAYTLGGNAFALTGGITNSSTSLQTINNAITTTAARTITMTSGGGNVTLGGNLSGAGGGFTLAGTGILTLSGSNSYTGAITTTASTILQLQANAGNTSTSGSSSAMATQNMLVGQLPSGATIQLRADSTVASGGIVAFDSGATQFGLNSSFNHISGTLNFDVNQLTTGSNLTLQFGSPTAIWQPGGSPNGSTITFNVTGGNGYTLQLGTMNVGNNDILAFNPTTANMIIGGITNGSTGVITKSGAGTLTITGASTQTGATSITGGILNYQNGTAFGANSAITVSSGATAQVQGGIAGGSKTLTLAGAGATNATGALDNVSGANSYSGPVTLTAATTISSDAGTLSLTGASIGGNTFGLTLAGAGNGSISNVIGTTTGTLTKSGAGQWTLSGANTYTGTTTVTAGTLDFAKETSLYNNTNANWTASDIIVQNGATLAVQVGSSPNFTSVDIGTLLGMASSATGGFETGSSLGLDTTPGNFTYTGGIANAYTGSTLGLAKLGANTLTLTGANTYTGATNVSAGTLALDSSAPLGNTAITVASGATLQVTPSFGATTIGSSGGASLTLSGGSTLLMGTAAESSAFNTLNLSGGMTIGGSSSAADLTFAINGTSSTSSDLLNVSGAVSFGTDGGLITLVEPSGSTAPSGATQTYTLVTAGSGLTSGGLSLAPTSQVVLLGANSYDASLSETGGTTETLTLNEVTLTYYWLGGTSSSWSVPGNFSTDHTGAVVQTNQLGSTNNVILTADSPSGTNTASQTLDNSYTINSLTYSSTAPATNLATGSGGNGASNTLTLTAATGFSITVGASPVTTTYGSRIGLVMQNGSAAQTLNVPVALGASQTWEIDSPTNALTVQGAISDGGTGYSLTKTGVGTLILSAANTYSGGTFVNAGTLALGAANALLTTGTATVEGTGTLDLAGNNQTLAVLSDGTVATGTVTSSSGTPTLTIGSGTFSGTISGSLSLTENGNSTLTLSGVNTYTGATTIASGTLTIGGTGQLGSGSYAGNISNAGTFIYNSSAAQNLSGTISGAGAFTDSGGGTLTLSSNLSGGGAITNSGAGTFTLSGNISGGSAITSSGAGGTLTLSGANSFTGGISIGANATLQLQANAGNTVSGISSVMPTENMTNGQLVSGATIQLRADSAVASGGVVVFDSGAANIGLNSGGDHIGGTYNFDVNQVASGSNLTLQFAPNATWNLGTPSPVTFNVTGGNGYTLQLGNFLPGQNASIIFNPTTANMIVGSINDTPASTGGVTKNGAGTLMLTGSDNSAGTTAINAGTLVVSGSISGTSATTVASAASLEVDGLLTSTAPAAVSGTLSGVGTVNGATLTSGEIAAGDTIGSTAVGTLTSTGNISLDSASTLSFRLGLNSTTDADQLAMTNSSTLTLDNSLLQILVGSGASTLDQLYVIVNGGAGSTSGAGSDSFINAPFNGTNYVYTNSGGFVFDVFYATDAANDGGNTGDIDVELVAVPEPGTWASLLCGLGILVAWQRLRTRRLRSSELNWGAGPI